MFSVIFERAVTLEQLKNFKTEFWFQFFKCNIDDDYVQSLVKMVEAYIAANLSLNAFIASTRFGRDWWAAKIEETHKGEKNSVLIDAITRVSYMDTALAATTYARSMTDIVEKQSLALQELTTPTIQLWEGILILPIVGIVDSNRAQIMTTAMLTKIQQTASRTIIIDITGVATVDSGVANHLIKITKATRLMGCTCILSGIGPEVAQILVHLGLSLESVETSGNLQSAFKTALLRSGQTITEKQPDGAR